MADETLSIPEHTHLQGVLDWTNAALTEGEAWLKSQTGYDKIDPTMRRIMSDNPELRSTQLSKVCSNRFAHIALNLASAMTDIKPFFEFKTHNPRYEDSAVKGNKFARSWWLTRQIDLRFLDSMKWALAAATGYAHLVYDPTTDDLDQLAEDPRDVIPVRPASIGSLQDCFAVLIRRERTLNWVKQMYPDRAAFVKPDRDGFLASVQRHNIISQQVERLGLDASPFWSHVDRTRRKQGEMSIPTVDVYTLYVKDRTRNKSGFTVEVGDNEYAWKYKVRKGDLLYPRLRRIIFTRSAVLEDNPSPYWHGLIPLVKITLDPWPWSYLGKSPLWDLLPLQDELDRILRAIGDSIQKFAHPDVVTNSQAISRAEHNKINTRLPGLKLRVNPMGGPNPVIFPPPPNVPPWVLEVLKGIISEMETLSGVQDVTNLVKLNQIPSSETIERMMEAMTPLVRMRSRVIEAMLREFAQMTFSNFCQFYNLPKRLALLGPEGMTFEDFDTDPGTLIPDYIEGVSEDSTREERARAMLRMFTYHVAPGSLLSASEITNKMLYFQLWRGGLIDRVTLAEKLDIPNYGKLPGDPHTVIDRMIAEAEALPQPTVSPAGRKASGQEAPRMVVKGGRTTVTESP